MRRLKNREEAGKILAENLSSRSWKNTCILALPRGGVPIAWEIAKKLDLPWDVLIVKKIGAPENVEYAIGAMAEDEKPLWNENALVRMALDADDLESIELKTKNKIKDLRHKWKENRKSINLKNKNIIIVDDGLATGLTMRAAIEYLKTMGAEKITIAVPVASRFTLNAIKNLVDEVVVLHAPEPFFAVGQWYENFEQVSNEFVTNLLYQDIDQQQELPIKIPVGSYELAGFLSIPTSSKGIIIFAHGSGSSHQSPRNRSVAKVLNRSGFATLLFDLLTPAEAENRSNVFDMHLLSQRLLIATGWARKRSELNQLPIGYFGASTGAGAALIAAANPASDVFAVVSRGGRPDMAQEYLHRVSAPTLLIVGGEDFDVIQLNRLANSKLKNGKMAIIPKAGHLFEEPGTMEQVIEHASNWFNQSLPKQSGKNTPQLSGQEAIVEEIKGLATPVLLDEDLDALVDKIANAKIVMLGEATHGTEEFYRFRKIISQKLIEKHGFNFIAVEGDWPDCYRLNRYIHSDQGNSAFDVMQEFKRWPTWMWANDQVLDLIEWMKGKDASFYGMDVYSLYESLDLAKAYARRLEPKLAEQIDEAYACFESFNHDEIAYARSVATASESCEEEVLANLRAILRLRLKSTSFKKIELFDFQQNAKIIHNAEKYYHAMIHGGPESWNIRDEHMMDTLDALLQLHGKDAKAIVWAHNTHIGDYHATSMLDEGYINIGGLARERYGMENVALVGFGTNEGEVIAGKAWGARPERMRLHPAVPGSYEHFFHQAAQSLQTPALYVQMPYEETPLRTKAGHRAVGVVYQTFFGAKEKRNYVPTNLAMRYDTFIFIDKTSALKALDQASEKGVLPETWPVGF